LRCSCPPSSSAWPHTIVASDFYSLFIGGNGKVNGTDVNTYDQLTGSGNRTTVTC
jgi:hypothetical protein